MSTSLEERIRRLEDIDAIKQLKAEYCSYCDNDYEPDKLAALFTEDAVWDGKAFGRHEGREAIRAFFAEAPEALSFAIHNVMNPSIAIDGDRATGRWYLLQPCTAKASKQALWLTAVYHDRYRRVGDTWRFEHVDIEIRFFSPHESGWAKMPMVDL